MCVSAGLVFIYPPLVAIRTTVGQNPQKSKIITPNWGESNVQNPMFPLQGQNGVIISQTFGESCNWGGNAMLWINKNRGKKLVGSTFEKIAHFYHHFLCLIHDFSANICRMLALFWYTRMALLKTHYLQIGPYFISLFLHETMIISRSARGIEL